MKKHTNKASRMDRYSTIESKKLSNGEATYNLVEESDRSEDIMMLSSNTQSHRIQQDVQYVNHSSSCIIQLKEGVSIWNASNIFWYMFVFISAGSFYNLSILNILKDPKYLGKTQDEVSVYTSELIFYSNLSGMLFVLLAGYFHDKLGRRITLSASVMIMSGCISILPWIKTVYPGFLVNSIIFSFSTNAI